LNSPVAVEKESAHIWTDIPFQFVSLKDDNGEFHNQADILDTNIIYLW
jgi:hypothetical protein